eukprot:TRINITY_DN9047_c2_g1_i2.p1 TRINITY_DN9047_c2_g1~~TRINITY_DN9047_c2_g1_i2.p1  ORF type:complete len:152 (+),score=13.86 TRINITY_DN9047_c2_g1_i2:47-502(+)
MPMSIFAVTPDGEQHEIFVERHSSVNYAKSLICEEVGFAMHLTSLEYCGEVMKGVRPIMDYGITPGEEIRVIRSEVCTYDESESHQRAAQLIQTNVRGHMLRRGLRVRRSAVAIQRAFRNRALRRRVNAGGAARTIQRFFHNYISRRPAQG